MLVPIVTLYSDSCCCCWGMVIYVGLDCVDWRWLGNGRWLWLAVVGVYWSALVGVVCCVWWVSVVLFNVMLTVGVG